MNVKRLLVIVLIGVAVVGGVYVYTGRIAKRDARLEAPRAVPSMPPLDTTRPWRWQTESEWVVHEVTRGIVSWAAFARNEDPQGTRLSVRKVATPVAARFEVTLAGPGGPRNFTIDVVSHVWDPAAYVGLARTLLGSEPAGEAAAPPDLRTLLLASDTPSLRRADGTLFAALSPAPRSASLHEEAALLWAAHALRETDTTLSDERPFLNGITTHLALARAVREGSASPAGTIAGAALDALVRRQVEAMAAIDAIDASDTSSLWKPWTNALRLRITLDPRKAPADPKLSRLERLEAVRALHFSRSCRHSLDGARERNLPPAADWVRMSLWAGCDSEAFEAIMARMVPLQAEDASRLVDTQPSPTLDETVAVVAAASAQTHSPERPSAVIPRYVRADAGLRHLAAAISAHVGYLRARALPDDAARLAQDTESLRARFPQRIVLDLGLHSAAQLPQQNEQLLPPELCVEMAKLIADRPDLVPLTWWNQGSKCAHPALRMIKTREWLAVFIAPGTGLQSTGPWRTGSEAAREALDEARRHAPWDLGLADRHVFVRFKGEPAPSAELLAVYGPLLEYNLPVLTRIIENAPDDAQVETLAQRACDIEVDLCAGYGAHLAEAGREAAARGLFERAMTGSRDPIALSNSVAPYVNLLLDAGETAEAMKVARRAAAVGSALGLFTLAAAHERLGQFDAAAAAYAQITRRYRDPSWEQKFFVRYAQRHGSDRFQDQAARAMAAMFPKGLRRKTKSDFERERHQGGTVMDPGNLTLKLYRFGLRPLDFVVAVDGLVVENNAQMEAVLTFTDDPKLSLLVIRPKEGLLEIRGPYRRWRYGPPAAKTNPEV
jgi:hypothetical protein